MPEKLLTIRDVMAYLGVSKATVDRMISSGRLKSLKIGRARRIKREDLMALVEEGATA